MNIRKKIIAFAAVLLVAPALPGAAGAHVEMTTTEAPAGKPVNLTLEIGHGCEGASTIALEVQIPAQATGVRAQSTSGWKASTTGSTMTWKGGPLADHDVQEYPFQRDSEWQEGTGARVPVDPEVRRRSFHGLDPVFIGRSGTGTTRLRPSP